MPGQFAGKVVLITGASRGIGEALAGAFAAAAANVALVSTDGSGATRVAQAIAANGGRALPLAGDVACEADVRRLVEQTEATLGPVHILVNNAAVMGPTAPLAEIELSEWQRTLEVNLTGAFLCSREVLRRMLPRLRSATEPAAAGCIVNIGSLAGRMGYPQRSPYAASKWGLVGLTKTLAQETGPFGVRVNCICPGPVKGERIEDVLATRARALGLPLEKVREQFIAPAALKRFVRTDDVVSAVLFLASDSAANITGQVLNVCGGWNVVAS